MKQFLIHIVANNAAAAAVSKKNIPANFEDFESADGGARGHDRKIGRPPYLQVGYDQVQDNFFGNEFF